MGKSSLYSKLGHSQKFNIQRPSQLINRKLFVLIFSGFILLIGYYSDPVFALTMMQQRTLVLLIVSIVLWSTKAISTGIASLLIIGLQLLIGIAPKFSTAAQGFLSTSIYFILAVTLISRTMVKVGLIDYLSSVILYISKGSVKRTSLYVYFFSLVLPLILPSGNARLRMSEPLLTELNGKYDFDRRSPFIRFTIWTLSGVNQISTAVVFTGGGFGIAAAQMLSDDGYTITWLSWLLMMAPPIWLVCLILLPVMWKLFHMSDIEKKENDSSNPYESGAKVPVPAQLKTAPFWTVILCLIFMLILWVIGPYFHIPAILPPLICLGILAIPSINLLSNNDLRSYD
jgi:sodium-dependent dicarboxylate transporter 2/3/5